MRFSKRRGMSDTAFGILIIGVFISIGLIFLGFVVSFDGMQDGIIAHTTQTVGTVTYYSIVDGSATIVINTYSAGNQTMTCSLSIGHAKYASEVVITWPHNSPLIQASDPSVILGLKTGETVSIISGFNGCNVTVLSR